MTTLAASVSTSRSSIKPLGLPPTENARSSRSVKLAIQTEIQRQVRQPLFCEIAIFSA